jgi:uncharacterized membrane protein AbrB (regulator of aidB expression)
MSGLHRTLVALLVVSTGLFAIGAVAERSHGAQSRAAEAREAHPEDVASDVDERETVLGVDPESTALVVLAVLAGLGLAALTLTRFGRLPGFLLAVALIALAWSALDVREVIHQIDESRTGIAIVAIGIAGLHLAAAATSGRLARVRHVREREVRAAS